MKFYNPFKPHIIETNGHFYVRKLDALWTKWVYMDRDKEDLYWWGHMTDFCRFATLASAMIKKDYLKELNQKEKHKNKITVYT